MDKDPNEPVGIPFQFCQPNVAKIERLLSSHYVESSFLVEFAKRLLKELHEMNESLAIIELHLNKGVNRAKNDGPKQG